VSTSGITILIVVVRFIKKIPEGQKSVEKVTGNATWKMYQRLIFEI
jgi:hypothetical protein